VVDGCANITIIYAELRQIKYSLVQNSTVVKNPSTPATFFVLGY